jgi:predicted homoserine dehydrogenase-like protein
MIYRDLAQREAEGRPIRIGSSGAGWIGSGFVEAVEKVQGMVVTALADEDVAAARQAFLDVGVDSDDVVEASAPGPAMDALNAGKRIVSGDTTLLAQLDAVDIVTDVTYSPAIGAETAHAAITHGKDVVLVNIEADATVGRILKQKAADAGVLYTVSSGDEPGCLIELWDFVKSLNYEVMVIGKGKNNPLNPTATPDTVAESARKANKNPWTVASYVDGTKTMFEMTVAANATGCVPMQRGMIGPEATLDTVSEVFALESDGGLTQFPGAVDFVQGGAMAGGVFVTVRIDSERICDDLNYLKVGRGRYFTFFRPYHLWFLEAPISVARACLYGQPTLVPLDEPVCENMAVAKRDLTPGETLDDFGGYTQHGVMDRAAVARDLDALPVGLAPGAVMARSVAAGQIITWSDVRLDENSTVVRLRREQDALAG